MARKYGLRPLAECQFHVDLECWRQTSAAVEFGKLIVNVSKSSDRVAELDARAR